MKERGERGTDGVSHPLLDSKEEYLAYVVSVSPSQDLSLS